MVLHVMTCNYSYSLGIIIKSHPADRTNPILSSITTTILSESHTTTNRPLFQGGTLSLNSIFLSILLLVSRFPTSSTTRSFASTGLVSFGYLLLAILFLALYPTRRHVIASTLQQRIQEEDDNKSLRYYWYSLHAILYPLLVTGTLSYGIASYFNTREQIGFGILLVWTLILAPLCTAGYIQTRPDIIHGPWDIPMDTTTTTTS